MTLNGWPSYKSRAWDTAVSLTLLYVTSHHRLSRAGLLTSATPVESQVTRFGRALALQTIVRMQAQRSTSIHVACLQSIIKSYRQACTLAVEKVKELSVSLEDKGEEQKKELLLKCAATSLNSKLVRHMICSI